MSAQMAARTPDVLRALDPELPIVAARAAMQLDAAIQAAKKGTHKPLRVDAISQLAAMMADINAALVPGVSNSVTKNLMDPLTANIISKAYAAASNTAMKSSADLRNAAEQLSEMFKKIVAKEQDIGTLSLLRDFCVRLSEYAASKRQLAYGERPTSSYWRLN